MKKYTTKPIDFTGCHPVIAEALKRGEAIECFVWDEEGELKIKAWVCGYARGTTYKYRIKECGYAYAKPIPRKVRRIMPPERAIPVLIAEGWAFNKFGDLVRPGWVILSHAFQYFGKPSYTPGVAGHSWPPCIVEEVEDDE